MGLTCVGPRKPIGLTLLGESVIWAFLSMGRDSPLEGRETLKKLLKASSVGLTPGILEF